MSNDLTPEKKTKARSQVVPDKEREDWCGSSADRSDMITFQRVWNGVIVQPWGAPHTATALSDMVVLQNTEQLCDFIQQWLKATAVQK